MNNEQIKKIIEDTYDESKEDTLRSMVREAFSKQTRWILINIWAWFLIFLAPLILSVIEFFRTDQTKWQIMYGAIFVCCFLSIGFLKVFGWVMWQRHSIKREIKRLEIRIATLAKSLEEKADKG